MLRAVLEALAVDRTAGHLPQHHAAGDAPFFHALYGVVGETIEIHGQRMRFHGIDAPESGQRCLANGEKYRCGKIAAFALSDRIGASTVRCKGTDIDPYKRVIAVCDLGRIDLNEWMVRNGHAVAYRRYSKAYVPAENEARARRRGLWAGKFVMPWDWRRGER